MTFENLVVVRANAVATVTVSRPKVLNALNTATILELDECISGLDQDGSVRVIVLTGSGDRAFIAGADIVELSRTVATSAREVARRGQALCDRLERANKPVIAAVNGFALGGGLEIAMACTVRLAADTAKFGQPEVNLGILPGFGGTQRLPRLVGSGRALELLLTGEPISADEAWRLGLVNRVVPADRLMHEAKDFATKFAAKAPLAVKYILNAVRDGMQVPLAEACDLEASFFELAAATDDMREGTQAFLEKRPADFRGQ